MPISLIPERIILRIGRRIMGSPLTNTSGLGQFSVRCLRRVPLPAATMTQQAFSFIKSTPFEVLFIIEKREYSQTFILVQRRLLLRGLSYQICTVFSDVLF